MKVTGPVLSAVAHAAVGGVLFLLVRSPMAQKVLPMMLLDAVAPRAVEPVRKDVAPPSRASRGAGASSRRASRAIAPPPGLAPAAVLASAVPMLDLGLVLEAGSGDIPAGAIVVAAATQPASPAPTLHSTIQRRPECAEPDAPPEPAERSELEYPLESRAAGAQGRLVVRVHVAADGSVSRATVVSSVDPSVDHAAVATLLRWRFHPARRCGRPVAGSYVVALRFELSD